MPLSGSVSVWLSESLCVALGLQWGKCRSEDCLGLLRYDGPLGTHLECAIYIM